MAQLSRRYRGSDSSRQHGRIQLGEKDAFAVELGRIGGLRGAKDRAEKFAAEQGSDAARKPAQGPYPKEP